jgi:four helix bundle protein
MLVAQSVALNMIVAIKPLVDAVARRDRNLADQMRRAAQSVVLNTAEGASSRGGNEAARYHSALASAEETRAALAVAKAWGYLEPGRVAPCEQLLRRVGGLLWGLVRRRTGAFTGST